MYRVRSFVAFAAAGFLVLSPAHGGTSADLATAVMLPSPLAPLIERRFEELRHEAPSDGEHALIMQLRSYYLSRASAPIWVSAEGWNKRASEAITVISEATDWGLDVQQFDVPPLSLSAIDKTGLVDGEIALSLAVVKYAAHARGGRLKPSDLSLWLDAKPQPVSPAEVLAKVITSANAGAGLLSFHPPFPEFERLREAYINAKADFVSPPRRDPKTRLESGPIIRLGKWHPDILKLRAQLGVPGSPGYESKFDEPVADALHSYLRSNRIRTRWGILDDRGRNALNRPPPPPKKENFDRILANMERWRWVPTYLGSTHFWNNLPEFTTRLFRDGQIIHEERIIVGQPDTQTPIFSDAMEQVVFQPEWGVPPSIKINDLLPQLQGGDLNVLDRRNMRIVSPKGKEIDPDYFNWEKIDIRDVGIYQRSGAGNPLGYVKFLFPNKHDVYMHDTNARDLFSAEERTFSHGCIRVKNPQRLAEIVLGMDQNWSPEQVKKTMFDRKKANNKIDLTRPIQVHNVYFTVLAKPDGYLQFLDDYYGHDRRVAAFLNGVSATRIAANDPARLLKQELEEAAPPAYKKAVEAEERAKKRRRSWDDDDDDDDDD